MERPGNDGHRNCYFCGEEGYLYSGYQLGVDSVEARSVIRKSHEGWPGIPHGGVGMTSFIELAHVLGADMNACPWSVRFRFGGDRLAIGDPVVLRARKVSDGIEGEIRGEESRSPYLKGVYAGSCGDHPGGAVRDLVEVLGLPLKSSGTFAIPMFSSRLIFRREHQLYRRHRFFEIRETEPGLSYLITHHGDTRGLVHCDEMNSLGERGVHPGPLIAMLDETLGWTAFMMVWQGGVTVELELCFLRPVRPVDAVTVMGLCTEIRGPHLKKIVRCHGGVFITEGDTYRPAVYCRGRWLTDPGFKEKMLKYIVPGYASLQEDE